MHFLATNYLQYPNSLGRSDIKSYAKQKLLKTKLLFLKVKRGWKSAFFTVRPCAGFLYKKPAQIFDSVHTTWIKMDIRSTIGSGLVRMLWVTAASPPPPPLSGGSPDLRTADRTQLIGTHLYCPKSNPNFYDITWNVEENEILHEKVRVVSRFPRHISFYIAAIWLPLGQCTIEEG